MNAVHKHLASTLVNRLLHLTAMMMVVASSLTLVSCNRERDLPTVVADRTTCSNCKMLVSETAYATAFRVGDEDQVFDDIGCMLDKLSSAPEVKPDHIWMRDFTSDTWIDAGSAFFAYHKELKTPMSFGYVAYAKQVDANLAASKVGGLVLSGFGELEAYNIKKQHAQN